MNMHMGMCVEMCTDMCMDMYVDMHIDICQNMVLADGMTGGRRSLADVATPKFATLMS